VTCDLLALFAQQQEVDLTAVCRALAECADAAGAIVFASDGELLTVAAAVPGDRRAQAALSLPVGFGVTGLVARNGQPVLLEDDSPRNPAYRQLLALGPTGHVARMCLPARGGDGATAGVVALHREPGRPFSLDDVARLQPWVDLLGLWLQNRQLLAAVHDHRSDRDQLIAQAISAQEAERRRIAFDLHDGVTTALASMSFHLSAAELSLSEPESEAADPTARARSEIAAATTLANLAYAQTRAAISGLHSLVLDDLGLVAALESLTQTAPQLDVEFRADPPEAFADVPDHCAAALYRIAQEAISNTVRHARASRAVLSLRRVSDLVVLGVTDDGVGFDPKQKQEARAAIDEPVGATGHFGLSSIAERCALVGASLRIESMPGHGTAVIVELPLSSTVPAPSAS
jgi:two-component system NarL family sensor kinase